VEKLASRLKNTGTGGKSPTKDKDKGGDGDEGEDGDDGGEADGVVDLASFDLLSKPRVLVFEGKVLKRSSSAFKRVSKRHLILLNDLLIVATARKSGLLRSNEKYVVNSIIPLDELAIRPYWSSELVSTLAQTQSNKGAFDPIKPSVDDAGTAFELLSSDKRFQLLAESEADKRVWMETISTAMLAYCSSARPKLAAQAHARLELAPGWQHLRRRGTLHSAALRGEMLEASFLLTKESSQSTGVSPAQAVNDCDDGGMTAKARRRGEPHCWQSCCFCRGPRASRAWPGPAARAACLP
jgi:hypothetical protein